MADTGIFGGLGLGSGGGSGLGISQTQFERLSQNPLAKAGLILQAIQAGARGETPLVAQLAANQDKEKREQRKEKLSQRTADLADKREARAVETAARQKNQDAFNQEIKVVEMSQKGLALLQSGETAAAEQIFEALDKATGGKQNFMAQFEEAKSDPVQQDFLQQRLQFLKANSAKVFDACGGAATLGELNKCTVATFKILEDQAGLKKKTPEDIAREAEARARGTAKGSPPKTPAQIKADARAKAEGKAEGTPEEAPVFDLKNKQTERSALEKQLQNTTDPTERADIERRLGEINQIILKGSTIIGRTPEDRAATKDAAAARKGARQAAATGQSAADILKRLRENPNLAGTIAAAAKAGGRVAGAFDQIFSFIDVKTDFETDFVKSLTDASPSELSSFSREVQALVGKTIEIATGEGSARVSEAERAIAAELSAARESLASPGEIVGAMTTVISLQALTQDRKTLEGGITPEFDVFTVDGFNAMAATFFKDGKGLDKFKAKDLVERIETARKQLFALGVNNPFEEN